MTDVTEDAVREWLDSNEDLFDRAQKQIARHIEDFLADWAVTWEFTHEGVDKARVKDAPRTFRKALHRELTGCEQLLKRCYPKDERDRFPVHDLLGVRVLVRSLNDVAALRLAIEELHAAGAEMYPLGNHEDFDLEDINESPRESGYRALHIDGSVTVRQGDTDFTVPFELQVKTLAQHVYGQHTHDEAYVPDDINEDPRYGTVRGLQRALAEQLNGVDLLLAQIEDTAGAIRDDIVRRAAGEDVDPASIANAVRETLGYKLRESAAAHVSQLALRAGVDKTADFAALIDPAGDAAASFASEFFDQHRRGPSPRELLLGLLGESDLVRGPIPTEELEAELSEDIPANPLDELDPEVDILQPDDDEGQAD
jgi:ppGpp synthetase/RelA/SpoT-type nucleotidyltranferase